MRLRVHQAPGFPCALFVFEGHDPSLTPADFPSRECGGVSAPSPRYSRGERFLSLPPRSGGEGGRRGATVGWGACLDTPHPDAHFIRVFPPHHSLTLVGGGITRGETGAPCCLTCVTAIAAFPGCGAARREPRRGALLIRGPCRCDFADSLGPGS